MRLHFFTMSNFTSVQVDLATVSEEIQEFQDLLDTASSLQERTDLLPFFRAHRQLTAWLGTVNTNLVRPDAIAYEHPIFGRYQADILVGDTRQGRFTLIELEDAGTDSIFKKKSRTSSYWSSRFFTGFSQLVDWLCEIRTRATDLALQEEFGTMQPLLLPALIVGRDQFLSNRERHRFDWFRQNVLVDSASPSISTYDELALDLDDRIQIARSLDTS